MSGAGGENNVSDHRKCLDRRESADRPEPREIVIPLRGVTYSQATDSNGSPCVHVSITFADNPLKYIPQGISGRFVDIMTHSSWDWKNKQLRFCMPTTEEMDLADFLERLTRALEDMMVEERDDERRCQRRGCRSFD